MIEAWHFLRSNRRTRFTAEGPLEAGSILRLDPDRLALCVCGLHASVSALDALQYAPGPIVCRVVLRGKILHASDKMCASEREILWLADATDVLRAFARECALRVIHLWDVPPVVREYLETGREDLRDIALSSSLSSAQRTARCAAQDAAWDAAWDASLDARIAKDADRADGAEREWQRTRLEGMILSLKCDT